MEALRRFRSRRKGSIGQDSFVSFADESGYRPPSTQPYPDESSTPRKPAASQSRAYAEPNSMIRHPPTSNTYQHSPSVAHQPSVTASRPGTAESTQYRSVLSGFQRGSVSTGPTSPASRASENRKGYIDIFAAGGQSHRAGSTFNEDVAQRNLARLALTSEEKRSLYKPSSRGSDDYANRRDNGISVERSFSISSDASKTHQGLGMTFPYSTADRQTARRPPSRSNQEEPAYHSRQYATRGRDAQRVGGLSLQERLDREAQRAKLAIIEEAERELEAAQQKLLEAKALNTHAFSLADTKTGLLRSPRVDSSQQMHDQETLPDPPPQRLSNMSAASSNTRSSANQRSRVIGSRMVMDLTLEDDIRNSVTTYVETPVLKQATSGTFQKLSPTVVIEPSPSLNLVSNPQSVRYSNVPVGEPVLEIDQVSRQSRLFMDQPPIGIRSPVPEAKVPEQGPFIMQTQSVAKPEAPQNVPVPVSARTIPAARAIAGPMAVTADRVKGFREISIHDFVTERVDGPHGKVIAMATAIEGRADLLAAPGGETRPTAQTSEYPSGKHHTASQNEVSLAPTATPTTVPTSAEITSNEGLNSINQLVTVRDAEAPAKSASEFSAPAHSVGSKMTPVEHVSNSPIPAPVQAETIVSVVKPLEAPGAPVAIGDSTPMTEPLSSPVSNPGSAPLSPVTSDRFQDDAQSTISSASERTLTARTILAKSQERLQQENMGLRRAIAERDITKSPAFEAVRRASGHKLKEEASAVDSTVTTRDFATAPVVRKPSTERPRSNRSAKKPSSDKKMTSAEKAIQDVLYPPSSKSHRSKSSRSGSGGDGTSSKSSSRSRGKVKASSGSSRHSPPIPTIAEEKFNAKRAEANAALARLQMSLNEALPDIEPTVLTAALSRPATAATVREQSILDRVDTPTQNTPHQDADTTPKAPVVPAMSADRPRSAQTSMSRPTGGSIMDRPRPARVGPSDSMALFSSALHSNVPAIKVATIEEEDLSREDDMMDTVPGSRAYDNAIDYNNQGGYTRTEVALHPGLGIGDPRFKPPPSPGEVSLSSFPVPTPRALSPESNKHRSTQSQTFAQSQIRRDSVTSVLSGSSAFSIPYSMVPARTGSLQTYPVPPSVVANS